MRSRRQFSSSLVIVLVLSLGLSLSSGALVLSRANTSKHTATHSRSDDKGAMASDTHGTGKHETASPVIKTARLGPLQLNITQTPEKMDRSMQMNHNMNGRTTLTNLDSMLKTSPYSSNAFAASAARFSGKAVLPAGASNNRAAQIVDVAVGPGASLSYSPDQVTINAGDTVRWTFTDVGHNVVSGSACNANNIFCSPDDINCSVTASSPAGAVYTHTFNQAGTFNYFCSPHCFNAMTGVVVVNAVTVQHAVNSDFDGDRKTDVSIFRPSDGGWYILQSTNNGFRSQAFGNSTDRRAPADYDGDGKTDVAVFRPSEGTFYILQSSNGGFRAVQFGTNGDVPMPGDYDNDGKADIAVFRPSGGAWYRLNSSNGAFVAVAWGASTDKPVLGDFDGDSKTDLAVFRPSEGSWYILQSSNNGFRGQQFGASVDTPVAADYDGDNKADVAVFRPEAGAWYISQSSNNAFRSHQFGISTDRPVAADYDGDGKADVAVFRPAEGTFYILQSTNNGVRGQQWGTNGDLPAPSAYVP